MKAPYFSILIDAFNYGHYLEEAVESALAQDFPSDEREILVVDDGSTDGTAARLRKFGNAIRYLYKSNGAGFRIQLRLRKRAGGSGSTARCRRRVAAA